MDSALIESTISMYGFIDLAGFYSEVQRFEAWQYNFTVITRKAIEDGIQAFNKGAAPGQRRDACWDRMETEPQAP